MAELITIRSNSIEGSLTNSNLQGDTIFTSSDYQSQYNSTEYTCVRVTLSWNSLVSTPSLGIGFSGILESREADNSYTPVAYTFSSYNSTEFGRKDSIVCDRSIVWTDAGVPNGIFVAGRTIALVSYNPVTLPDTWRVRIVALKQSNTTFTSLDVDITAELYNPR